MIDKKFICMTTGSEIIDTLSTGLYSNIYYVFDELISNSYDSDATIVEIETESDVIIIRDNGEGMDFEGIVNFFSLGYSPKKAKRITNKFRRKTIGKFGIGKITTANICEKFQVISYKEGKKITATLDYNELKKKKYLHEHNIPIETKETSQRNRTEVILYNIKSPINETLLKRRIMRTMPLNPNFKVVLNGRELKPEDIISGPEFSIEFDTKNLGEIKGKATLSDKKIPDFAGVYIRVNGRIVNTDDPNWLNIATTIGYGEGFATRLYCIIDADILDCCILVNRNELKKDHPLFLEFKEELKKELGKLYRVIIKSKDKESIDQHSKIAKAVIEHQLNKMIENTEVPEDFMKIYSKRKDSKKIEGIVKKIKRKQSDRTENTKTKEKQKEGEKQNPHKIELGGERIVKIGKKKFKFQITLDMGKEDPECIFNTEEGIIYINANHPQYALSQAENSLYCHFRKAMAYEISKTIAKNMDELIGRYEDMLHAEIEIIED